jgi:hypothetical protein
MKNKKMKIIMSALACALIISAGAFMIAASAADKTDNPENLPAIALTSDGAAGEREKFPEFPEFPEGIEMPERPLRDERQTFAAEGKCGFGFGIGIGGINGCFGSDCVDIADMLGITEQEFIDKLKEEGNIFKILEDAGKLGEYKEKLLENFREKLDAQAACGAITKEQADEAYARLEEAVNNFSSDGGGLRGPGRSFRGDDCENFENSRERKHSEKHQGPMTTQTGDFEMTSM